MTNPKEISLRLFPSFNFHSTFDFKKHLPCHGLNDKLKLKVKTNKEGIGDQIRLRESLEPLRKLSITLWIFCGWLNCLKLRGSQKRNKACPILIWR